MRLTSKMGNKNFYKGSGSGSMGRWSKKGNYVLDPSKFRQWIIPDLSNFKLTPYVNPKIETTFRKSHSVRDYFKPSALPEGLDPSLVQNMQRAARDVSRMLNTPKARPPKLKTRLFEMAFGDVVLPWFFWEQF
ncbi:hypothetical protein HDU76_000979 [Blyttiomyces sp. JEL0837]|nr:hypothetical protein HDU76_000979 [Blyttiomyces sp. JEL0837]